PVTTPASAHASASAAPSPSPIDGHAFPPALGPQGAPLVAPGGAPFDPAHAAALDPQRRAPARPGTKGALIALAGAIVALALVTGLFVAPRFSAPMLQISTLPPGATVTLDGVRIDAVTPTSIEVDPGRPLSVTLELEGHDRQITDVASLSRGQTFALQASLQRTIVEVRVAPVPGRVELNGAVAGEGATVKLPPLDPAEPVELVVTAAGHGRFEARYPRGTKVPRIIEVTLRPE
ncbi:PEGA domain-containing protein, partial [Myxococcota bacterium]|nr:PEGA domain-containing protein [Myxococcota bacterium]